MNFRNLINLLNRFCHLQLKCFRVSFPIFFLNKENNLSLSCFKTTWKQKLFSSNFNFYLIEQGILEFPCCFLRIKKWFILNLKNLCSFCLQKLERKVIFLNFVLNLFKNLNSNEFTNYSKIMFLDLMWMFVTHKFYIPDFWDERSHYH